MKITNSITGCWIVCFLLATAATAAAAPLSEARVSQVIQDVRLLAPSASPRPAIVNDNVRLGTAVRTGTQSRAELTFHDLTITRLGENTIFSLKEGTRDLKLEHGSILLQVPSGAPAATIQTAAVTAAVSGGTAMFGTGPPIKFMVLEGVGTFYPTGHPEQAVTLHGGDMVTLTPDGHVQVSTFDVKLVLESSPLITEFPDLANLPLILQVQNQQQTDQSNPGSNPPPSQNPLTDVIDLVTLNVTANPAVVTTTPPSSGPPSEFGSPSTITTPDPYVISSGTTIQTDPTITTNSVTDFGKLYRGTALDGTPSQFLFGVAPTSFDQMVFGGSQKHLPIAVFKFADLELTGDPTIIVPSAGTTNLALVAVGTITSGAPGGTLTFTGIDRLDFITQNGSINLGSQISFANLSHLEFYARGTGSDLTLASPISNVDTVKLNAEGSIQVNGDETVTNFNALSGVNFLTGSGTITATNIDIESLNNININASQFPNPAVNTGSVTLNAINTLNLNLNLDRGGGFGWSSLDASAATINIFGSNGFNFSNASGDVIFAAGNGGINASGIEFFGHNLTLTSTGDISIGSAITPLQGDFHILDGSITAGGAFTSSGDVYTGSLSAGTTITIGGTLSVGGNITAGGDITATSSSGNISITVGGALTSTGGGIAASVDNSGGSIGSDASVNISAANVSTAGSFDAEIDNDNGGMIGGRANVSLNATGNVTVSGANGITLQILNEGGSIAGGMPGDGVSYTVGGTTSTPILTLYIDNSNGGVINTGGSAILNTTGPVMMNGPLVLEIDNFNGGSITNGANVTAHFVGDVTDTVGQFHSLNFFVLNGAGFFNPSVTGGTITTGGNIDVTFDGNAETTPTSSTGSFAAEIENGGGTIGTGGNISLTVGGNVVAGGQGFDVDIENQGGQITNGGNVTVDVAGGITSATSAFFGILNQNGFIGSDATVNVNAASISTTGPFQAEIDNFNGGTIGGSATVQIGTTGDLSADSVTVQILNTTGSIGGSASTNLNIAGDATVSGVLQMLIENHDFSGNTPGQFGGGANISITTGGDLSAGSLIGLINNRSGGSIGSAANLIINVGGALTTSGESTDPVGSTESLSLTISTRFANDNGNPALASIVGGDATLTVNADSASIGGRLFALISNSGSTLNGNALVSLGITHDVLIQGEADIDIFNDADSASPLGGMLHGSAILQLSSNNFTANALFAQIDNRDGAVIDSNATIAFNLTGSFAIPGTNPGDPNSDFTVPGEADVFITNQKRAVSQDSATTGGTIGGNALIQLSAASVSTAGLLDIEIQNFRGGTIGGDATIEITSTGDVTADSLDVEINNSGGSVGGNETINMNVGGTAATTGDATFAIRGNDPTGAAAINFNGGDYEVGGNFRSTIDGNGTIAFNSTTVNANTLKAAVFGSNGTIMIGSGPLSANTLMKLYATGSSGTIDFTKSVTLTLTSQTAAIILAANTITIDQNVVVTIVGSFPASVYANIANYVGGTCGNNCGSFGSFAGKGATTSALGGQPGFDDPPASATSATKSSASGSTTVASSTASSSTKSQSSSSTTVASSSSVSGASRRGHRSSLTDGLKQSAHSLTRANTTTTTSSTIKVSDSGQLLSMLDSATPSSNGKIMITSSKGDRLSNNPSPSNPNHPNGAPGLSHDRSAAENQTSSKTAVALLDHTPPSVR